MSRRLAAVPLAAAALALPAFAGSAPAARTAGVASGVVDVNIELAYQGASAAGTGIVLKSSGEVLTNNHVIRGATRVRVADPSTGKAYAATVLGYSVTEDVAVLKLTGASHLRTATVGNSAAAKVGSAVTAVGNARGRGGPPAVTTGRIIRLGQSIVAVDGEGSAEQLRGLIETNAALEPGDSGGPLLNRAAKVIGMNTAGSASGGGFAFRSATAGDGFAIPINKAMSIVKQIDAGRPSATVHVGGTAFLGISVSSGGGQPGGAFVAAVVPGGPADQAGITAGSVITSLDGAAIGSPADLGTLLERISPGTSVTVAWVDESGASQTASVTTAAGPPR